MTQYQSAPTTEEGRRNTGIVIAGILLLVACAAAGGIGAFFLSRDGAEPAEEPAVAYILDTSPRMSLDAEGGTRLSVARGVMAEVIRPANPELTSGLRVFGSGAIAQACDDTNLVVPYAVDNHPTIADGLGGVVVGASSESALAQSMIAAIRDLDAVVGPQSIVVVTGGEDSCNPEAGALVRQEAERAGIDVQTYLVGFMVSPDQAVALKTMSDQMGGSFYDAPDSQALRIALIDIMSRIERGGAPSLVESGEGEPEADQPEEDAPAATEATPEPTAPPATGGYVSQTACDHPYFPLRPGAQWAYVQDGEPANWSVAGVAGDLTAANADVTIAFGPGSITYDWTCGTEGIFHYQAAAFDFSELGGAAEVELTASEGAPLLPADQFFPGATWDSSYTMVITATSEGLSFSITNDVSETHTVGDPVEISTAAGAFEALPIFTSRTTVTSGLGGTFTNEGSSTCWFAFSVGLIRCEDSSGGETSITELQSFALP